MNYFFSFILGWFVCLIIFQFNPTYKEGQVDCINGKINYQLKVNPNNSVSWEKIK